MILLTSDTETKPTIEMRQAIAKIAEKKWGDLKISSKGSSQGSVGY